MQQQGACACRSTYTSIIFDAVCRKKKELKNKLTYADMFRVKLEQFMVFTFKFYAYTL
jgi:hypothetical protein